MATLLNNSAFRFIALRTFTYLQSIPCPFPALLGFMLIAPRSRSVPQGYVHVPQPNLQIKAFSNLNKVLTI